MNYGNQPMMAYGPMSRPRYRGEVESGLFEGMELSPADLKYRGQNANYKNRMLIKEARDFNDYLDRRRGGDRQAALVAQPMYGPLYYA